MRTRCAGKIVGSRLHWAIRALCDNVRGLVEIFTVPHSKIGSYAGTEVQHERHSEPREPQVRLPPRRAACTRSAPLRPMIDPPAAAPKAQ
jgi:hypothetical protein